MSWRPSGLLTTEQQVLFEQRAAKAPKIQSNIVKLVEAGVIEFDTSKYYAGGLGTGSQSNIVIDNADAMKMFPEKARPLAMNTNEKFAGYLLRTDGLPFQFYSLSKSFKMTVAPRFQVEFIIWQPIDTDTSNQDLFSNNTFVLGTQGTGWNGAENDYNDFLEKYGAMFGETFLNPSMWMNFKEGGSYKRTIGTMWTLDEGDSIEYDHERKRFTVIASGEVVIDNKTNVPTLYPIEIGTISAANTQKTDEQIETQGLLDDPLTPEDETIEGSSDTAFSDRVAEIKRLLEAERNGRYRNGSQTIGSAFLAGLAYMALTFIRRG